MPKAIIEKANSVKELPTGIWAVSISMMLIAISTTMTFAVSPFYMTEVLGIGFIALGLLEGFTEALSYGSKLVSGFSGDFFKRKKPPLVLGVIMATVSKPIFILAGSMGMVVTSKIIERISNGVMAVPRDAYCAEECHPSIRGKSLGLMMSLKTFGCAIGSLLAGGLAIIFPKQYQLILWFGFIPCFLSLIVLLKFMKEHRAEKKLLTPEQKAELKKARLKLSDFKALNGKYWAVVIIASIFMCARFTDGFLLLRMQQLGAPEPLCLSIIGIFNLIGAICCLPIGALSDRLGRYRVLYFSFVTLVLSNLCFMFPNTSLPVALLGVLFWGAQRGTSQMLFSAMIADVVPEKIIGTALGVFYVISGLTAIIAGKMAGELAEAYALNYAFIYSGVTASIALVVLFIYNQFFRGADKKGPQQARSFLDKDLSTNSKIQMA